MRTPDYSPAPSANPVTGPLGTYCEKYTFSSLKAPWLVGRAAIETRLGTEVALKYVDSEDLALNDVLVMTMPVGDTLEYKVFAKDILVGRLTSLKWLGSVTFEGDKLTIELPTDHDLPDGTDH